MKVSELANQYILHDSLVEDISINESNKTLKLKIELCNWKQIYYKKTDPEMLNILVVFNNVTNFALNPEDLSVDSDEILEVKTNNGNTIKFTIYNEEIKIIEVTAESVDVVVE